MRIVVQRALDARVTVEGKIRGEISRGFVVLVGVTHTDTEEDADYLVRKLSALRVFEDDSGKMNLSLSETGGQVLSISQFTLYADTRKGNRPSFVHAAPPEKALPLYTYFNDKLRSGGICVRTGEFGADMKVSFVNDGPVTILIDSKDR